MKLVQEYTVVLLVTGLFLGIVQAALEPAGNANCRLWYGAKIDEILDTTPQIYGGFPMCIDRQHPDLIGFEDVLAKYDDPKEILTELAPSHLPGDQYLGIATTIIRVPNDPSLFNWRNWATLFVIVNPNIVVSSPGYLIRRVIIQGITSPLGLPDIQFRLDVKECDRHSTSSSTSSHVFSGVITDPPPGDAAVLIPCKYRSKSALRHPHVFSLRAKPGILYKTVAVHFNLIDTMCNEHLAAQFNLLIEFGDGRKEGFISWLYKKQNKYLSGGIPFPYHPSLQLTCPKRVQPIDCTSPQCRIGTPEIQGWGSYYRDILHRRIIYNQEYDDCIQTDKNLDLRTKECPPGPFYCPVNRTQAASENEVSGVPNIAIEKTDEKYREELGKSWLACPYDEGGGRPPRAEREQYDCNLVLREHIERICNSITFPTIPPTYRRSLDTSAIRKISFERADDNSEDDIYGDYSDNPPDDVDDTTDNNVIDYQFEMDRRLQYFGNIRKNTDKRHHGLFMTVAFFVLMSASNFLARFFKETGGGGLQETENGCCGLGYWIFGHVILSFVTLTIIWMGLFGPMLDVIHCPGEYSETDPEFLHCAANPPTAVLSHIYLGWLIVIIFHINFVLGWIRPLNRKVRMIATAVHSVSGHILQWVAFGAVLATTMPVSKKVVVGILLLVALAMSVGATVVQFLIDKKNNLERRRKLFPIAEHLKDNGWTVLSLALLGADWGIIIVFYLVFHFL